uniref:Zona pellucida sperm-binding protein 4 n=1 Tax=Periophthalmus magnuspinnatus TaxID=409849 RepID=A0A3B4ASF3_9GOBI
MAVRLVGLSLLAVILLGSLATAQYFKPADPQHPQQPKVPQNVQPPAYPRPPQQHPNPTYPQVQGHLPSSQKPNQPPQVSPEFSTCEVDAHLKIQCGLPGITASECQAINCCFDGQMCYYGIAVTLQCTKDAQVILVVARHATLPTIDLDSIHFLGTGQHCQAVGTTSAFVIYQFPATSCGTTVTDENGITYENRMSSSYEVAVGPYGAITRDSQFDLMFQCRYIGTTVEALVLEVATLPAPSPVAGPGPLNVELRLGNGKCVVKGCVEEDVAYTSYYTDSEYPVTKVLRDPVYVEVRLLERTDPNLVLTLGRCWATSSPNPQSLPQWDLLVNGCPYQDDRYQTTLVNVGPSSGLSFPSHYRRFIFKMFAFVAHEYTDPAKKIQHDEVWVPLKEKVYIHCNTSVCTPSLQNNCEPRCFRKRRDIAASVKSASRAENTTTTVTSQGIIIMDQRQEP